MKINLKDLGPGETLGDRLEWEAAVKRCEREGHTLATESWDSGEGAEEHVYCSRCGMSLLDRVVF